MFTATIIIAKKCSSFYFWKCLRETDIRANDKHYADRYAFKPRNCKGKNPSQNEMGKGTGKQKCVMVAAL